MNAQPRHYRLNPKSELTRMLREATGNREPVILEDEGVRYRVVRETEQINVADDPWANYDPEKARAAILASAGALKGVDTKRLKETLRTMREQDSAGRPA